MLLYPERESLLLEHHADSHIKRFSIRRKCGIIRIFYISSGPRSIGLHIDIALDIFRINIFYPEKPTRQVHHRTDIPVTIHKSQRRHAVLPRHTKVVSAKCAGYMHYARTVICGHVIAWDHPESALARIHPLDKLIVTHAHKRIAIAGTDYLIGHHLVALDIGIKRLTGTLGIQYRSDQRISTHNRHLLSRIWVECAYDIISYRRSYRQRRIRRKSPRSCGPCQEIGFTPSLEIFRSVNYLELGYAGGVLYIAVTSGLIQFMRTKSGACRRRIRLYGITLVKISLVV